MKSTPLSFRKRWARALKKGFTLVEILAVVAIIAILATLTVNISKSVSSRQAQARATGDMAAIAGALELYKQTYGDYLLHRTSATYTGNDLRTATSATFPRLLTKAIMGDYYVVLTPGTNSALVMDNTSTDLRAGRRAFADSTIFRYSNGTSSYSPNTTMSIVDPWNNPYLYLYKNNMTYTASSGVWHCEWLNPSFILMSMGPDGTVASKRTATGNLPTTVQTTGVINDNYRSGDLMRMDNIIYGSPQ